MSEVTLSIGGRDYTVSCGPGEEAHVAKLGAVINDKMQQLGEGTGAVETQKLLFSALFLADELHEAQKAADAGKEAQKNAVREARLATGKSDELKLTISSLESELEGLQSAQQRSSSELDDIRSELKQRREESEACRLELEKTTAQAATLEQERATLAAQLEEIRSAPTPDSQSGGLSSNPELPPALERFADLLESCADKLEAGATNT